MKGLLTMDLLALKNMKRLFAVFVVLCIFYLVMDIGVFMVAFIPIVMASIFVSVSLSEYSMEKSQFLFTLPFSRKAFVNEKYLLGLGAPLLILAVLAGIYCLLKPDQTRELMMLLPSCACGVILLVAFMIPLIIKYKQQAQNYRLIVMVVFILVFAAGGEWITQVMNVIQPWLVWLYVIPVLLLAGSYFLSLKLIANQEF